MVSAEENSPRWKSKRTAGSAIMNRPTLTGNMIIVVYIIPVESVFFSLSMLPSAANFDICGNNTVTRMPPISVNIDVIVNA